MRRNAAILMTGLGLLLLGNGPVDPARIGRAQANYQALMSGAKQPGQFSRAELADMLALDRAVRHRDEQSPEQRCVDAETRRAGGNPSQLARLAIDLKCRPPGTGVN